jgi:exopolysaccharide biosynthesis protein
MPLRDARLAALPLFLVFLAFESAAEAKPGAGTVDDPAIVDAFPYAIKGSTQGSPSHAIDAYSCAPALDESGGEFIFVFTLPAPARVTAWVSGDGGGVDIDVHLLHSLNLSGTTADDCAARGNIIAEAEMAAGTHYVVVDSFSGDAQAGPFVLHLDAISDAWIERPIGEGVRWRARRFAAQSGGPQVVHEVVVDPASPGTSVMALQSSGCQTISDMAVTAGAVAAINGGYFDVSSCNPVSLLKSGGQLLATNGVSRGAFGVSSSMQPLIAKVDAGQDWPEAAEAHGGGPILVVASVARNGASDWGSEGFMSASFLGVNPRTIAGIDATGRILLGTVDGRRPNAAGMSLDALAAFSASAEIGAVDAVNLDGGGSSTMYVKGATPNGVVNYPSDFGSSESMNHAGSRGVSGGLFVLAPPFNHPPRFQTAPVTLATAGSPYSYDADAIDLDVDDILTFSLKSAPADMAIDPQTGEITFLPTEMSPPSADVTVVAADDHGAETEQTYTLVIDGGMGMGSAGAGGTGSGSGGSAGSGSGNGATPADDGGCACRTTGEPLSGTPPVAMALGLVALACCRRRRPL